MIGAADVAAVSAISCFEVTWLQSHARIELSCDRKYWFALLPIMPEIPGRAVDLPEHHTDPQDRLIIATALTHEAQLISSDRKFSLYKELAGRLF